MPPRPHAPLPCRFCARPLTPLERLRGDACDRLACRRAAVDARLGAEREADLAARRRAARDPALLAAPVVWLQPHTVRLVRVTAAERAAQRAHLQALAAAPPALHPPVPAAPVPPAEAASSPLPGQVCAFCAGRCCRHGAFTHAFVDRALLQRWLDAHPGATPQQAAAAYAQRLPRRHVEGSCLHHGRAGCTLPRAMRSDICNRHACDGLVAARDRVAAGVPHGLVVAMPATRRVQRAAWLRDGAAQPLPRRPRRR